MDKEAPINMAIITATATVTGAEATTAGREDS